MKFKVKSDETNKQKKNDKKTHFCQEKTTYTEKE